MPDLTLPIAPALARFVTETSYDDIPDTTRQKARISILDCCGTMLGGSQEEAAQIAQRYVSSSVSEAGATVLGTHLRTFPALAAFTNGIAAHALCYDDTHLPTMTHTSAVVLPATLALAEIHQVSGRELLTAYVIGFEVVATMGRIMGINHYKKGWHATSTIGVFGATAASARLLRLHEEQVVTGFALAASSAAGIRSNLGFMSMFYHAGNAARLGVDVANLALHGFSANPNALQMDMGFFEMYAGALDDVDPSAIRNIGNPFDLEDPGTSIKPFACGALSHRAIQAAINLRTAHDFSIDEIVKVECAVSYAHPRVLIHPRPRDILEGKISMQFPVAVALAYGRCGAQELTRSNLQKTEIQELIGKIEMVVPPELDKAHLGKADPYDTPANVTLYFKNGARLSETVERERGHPTKPFTYEQMWEKFYDSVAAVKTQAEASALYTLIGSIDRVMDLGPFFALLQGGPMATP